MHNRCINECDLQWANSVVSAGTNIADIHPHNLPPTCLPSDVDTRTFFNNDSTGGATGACDGVTGDTGDTSLMPGDDDIAIFAATEFSKLGGVLR